MSDFSLYIILRDCPKFYKESLNETNNMMLILIFYFHIIEVLFDEDMIIKNYIDSVKHMDDTIMRKDTIWIY